MTSIRALLEEIRGGKTLFKCPRSTTQHLSSFQGVVDALREAYERGLIAVFKPHEESHTGHRWVDRVRVEGLTQYGERYLDEDES